MNTHLEKHSGKAVLEHFSSVVGFTGLSGLHFCHHHAVGPALPEGSI